MMMNAEFIPPSVMTTNPEFGVVAVGNLKA